MKKGILQILLALLVFLVGISYADEQTVPKDASQAIELEHKDKLKNAEKFKRAASEALKNPIETSPDIKTKSQAIKYVCVHDTGGTWLERFGIRCERCAWYRENGSCTFQPGSVCTSERLTEFTYSCLYVPSENTIF